MDAGIYFDNASTSFPKPSVAVEAIETYLVEAGCSPGRSGHQRARLSGQAIDEARKTIADFLGCTEYLNIAYTYNATYALNFAIKGYLQKGDHVVTTCLEHNSVLRPLETLKRSGEITYDVVGLGKDGLLDLEEYEAAFQHNTKLVVVNHASNVTGVMNPIERMIKYAHKQGVKVLVDASQTAGFLDISMDASSVDFLAFTGHKSLLALPGIGGLFVRDESDLRTSIEGGTGGNSFSLQQPGYMPDKFEAGTCNYTGIVALGASINYLKKEGLEHIRTHERNLLTKITEELRGVKGVTLYGDVDVTKKVPVLSFNVNDIPSNELSTILDEEFGIMTRPGLQCAPLAHKAIGTHPNGTVRVSLGLQSTPKECEELVSALKKVIAKR